MLPAKPMTPKPLYFLGLLSLLVLLLPARAGQGRHLPKAGPLRPRMPSHARFEPCGWLLRR